jgi:primary-amine oxidase
VSGPPPVALHPLGLLTPGEVDVARHVLTAAGELVDGAVVVHVVLDEPTKDALAAWSPGCPVERRVRALVLPGPGLTMHELVIDVAGAVVVGRTVIEGMRPTLLFGESFGAILACIGHPEYVAALARRGITDLELVQIDPWPAGVFGYDAETDRRIARCITFLRDGPGDNGYARPVEGLIVHVDLGRGEVIEVIDHAPAGAEPIAVPTVPARYGVDDVGPLRTDLRPISITQPDGPSFTVEDGLVRWQKWSVRLGWDPYEGLVLHEVTYDDDGRTRSILHRASISEMVVPYGDPGEVQGWKNAFDAGEWGLGRMTQPLTLGCDCLGEIRYVDVTMADEQGRPWIVPNAICLHEEDAGIGWKHVDLLSGAHEVRRQRRLVISHIATVGNYEYGFYWYLHLDGTIGLETKLTGILSSQAVPAGTAPEDLPYAGLVADGVAAPVHQHLFCARLDLDIDGTANRVEEVEAEVLPPGPDNPWANGFRARSTLLATESEAQRETSSATSRRWRVTNPEVRKWPGGPASPPTTCGSRRTGPTSGGRRATSPTSTRAARACPSGPRPTARSWMPTWCSGTRSASPTCPAPRTGRSCPSSPPASCSAPSASSTATRPSTSRRRIRTTARPAPEHHDQLMSTRRRSRRSEAICQPSSPRA